jgi:hypothetical protein
MEAARHVRAPWAQLGCCFGEHSRGPERRSACAFVHLNGITVAVPTTEIRLLPTVCMLGSELRIRKKEDFRAQICSAISYPDGAGSCAVRCPPQNQIQIF